jgi:inhibitor of KinA sporulation pathway (predicted exonuclease)
VDLLGLSTTPGMKPEIIEIGVVEMDLTSLVITQEASHFIRPRSSEISTKCTQIRGITLDDVRKAKPLAEVLVDVAQKFLPANKPCCAWGDDVSVLARSCAYLGIKSPFRRPIDLCSAFQCVLAMKERASLRNAIHVFDLEFAGVPHGALPDARSAALLHASILRRLRGESDLVNTPSMKPSEVMSLSPFAQKLSVSIKQTKDNP